MLTDELILVVKSNLKITDDTRDLTIKDAIQEVLNHCNLKELPVELEPFIRKKVQSIINYEKENGDSIVFDVKSVSTGDTSVTYNVGDHTSKETIFGLSKEDKKSLQSFRRMRK